MLPRMNKAAAITATLLGASPAIGATLDSASAGLAAPDITIGFDEVALSTGDTVTNQFTAFGVTFTPGVTYFENVSARPNFSGAAAIEFLNTAFSIKFSDAVTDMSVAMTANFGSATFTTFLNGSQVESFSSALDLSSNNFYGFTNSLFDEVVVNPAGSTTVALDNLSFNVAPIPVPASLPLLAAGLGGLVYIRARKTKKGCSPT